MDDVVPGALQRLRAADIIRVAGLQVASLGQEYSRLGVVSATRRQGARLSGVVAAPPLAPEPTSLSETGMTPAAVAEDEQQSYSVAVQIINPGTWQTDCPCPHNAALPCVHAAALLYQWLADPQGFVTTPPEQSPPPPVAAREEHEPAGAPEQEPAPPAKRERTERTAWRAKSLTWLRGPMPLGNTLDILLLLPVNELRGIAREYEIAPNGLGKQQLAEAILEAFKRPEVVRRVVGTLEKAQRQLLAALSLAGGSLTDEDLRGLFERFSLGYVNQLQSMLSALQRKGLLFRANLHGPSTTQRFSAGSLLEVGLGWYVPLEVRAALHVTVPITTFDIEAARAEGQELRILSAEPYALLAELLLVARALDSSQVAQEGDEVAPGSSPDLLTTMRAPGSPAADGSADVPPPPGRPSPALLAAVQRVVPHPEAFLRFSIRLLRLADLLYQDDSGTPYWRVLPNASRLLLGPGHAEVARDLFGLWLTQASYVELYDLQQHGLRLRCRTTLMHHPALRPGELAAENSEARQALVALLAQVPAGRWVNFSAFARFIYRLNPAFLQRRQRRFPLPHWWLELEEGRPLRSAQLSDWLRVEGRYLADLLQGPLHWLGMCDLALDSSGNLQAFRLTALADRFFGGSAAAPEEAQARPEEGALIQIAETTAEDDESAISVACRAAAWPVIELVEQFAEVAGVSDGRLRYRLTPKSLSEALGRGLRARDFIELLRHEARPTGHALDALLARLERWLASYGRVRLYVGAALLQGADTLVMRELAAATSLDEQSVRELQPTLRILKKEGVEMIIADLERRGQVPLLHDEEAYGAE